MHHHPPRLFLPGHHCDTVHIQQHQLQQGILGDVSKAPDDSHGTAVWHTAIWFSARSTQLEQYTPPHKAPLLQDRQLQGPSEDTTKSQNAGSLEVRRKLLQNWSCFYSVSAHRTGRSAKMLTTGDVFSTVTIQFRHSRTNICFHMGAPVLFHGAGLSLFH